MFELLCFFIHLWHRWKSIQCSCSKPHPIPCSTSSKQQRLLFILYLLFLNHFPPWNQLNLYRTSPCSSGHGTLTQHTTSNCSTGKPGHRQSTSPVSQRTQCHKKRVSSALFNTPWQFSLCWCLCYFFLQTHVWVRHIHSTFLSLLVR